MTDARSRREWEDMEAEAQQMLGKRGGAFSTELEAEQFEVATGRAPRSVLDVGGASGRYAAACRRHYPDAHIVVVEPSSINRPVLEDAFGDDPLTSLVFRAAGSAPGQATLYANERGSELASLTRRDLRHLRIRFEAVEEVEVTTIDRICARHFAQEPVDLIKLDVEGHELDCLEGARQTLPRTTAVQFEFGGCNIDTRTYLRDFHYFFRDFGFVLHRIAPIGLIALPNYREHLESFMTCNFLAIHPDRARTPL